MGRTALVVAVVGPIVSLSFLRDTQSGGGLAMAVCLVVAILVAALVLAYAAKRIQGSQHRAGHGVILAALVIGWIEAALAVPIVLLMIWLHRCEETRLG